MISESLLPALQAVKYPGFSRDIVSFGLVKSATLSDGLAQVLVEVTTADNAVPPKIKSAIEEILPTVPGVRSCEVEVRHHQPKRPPPPKSPEAAERTLPGVSRVVAVASGKGGVGKSTVAVNLACALAQILNQGGRQNQVGLLDCDIYGPTVPLMMGLSDRPEVEENEILPTSNFGVKVMSMGLLVDEDAPVVWRGPMVTNAITQFARHVRWAPLEVLVVDLPPGTGDAQLSLAQTIPLDGALIVTTPQAAAVNVAIRGARMFDKVNVRVLGVIENMSHLRQADGTALSLFGAGGGKRTAQALNTRLLAQIPLEPNLREGGDVGVPVAIGDPASEVGQTFQKLARDLLDLLALPQ